MEDKLFELATSQGIWGVLFIFLFIYNIKINATNSEKQAIKEEKYQSIISDLTTKLEILNEINTNISLLKDHLTINQP
ncbi:BhlA/UviB family holin-like peptide [Anaerosacchariphilus polymeriproducens]|uniref:Bacteriocin UviB n=1 Tax=Anaerosacchariphilus polymeriproducens TaxID=1812858 RepID=A0A371ARY3_9FIRM|nr:BhlA/UviB family holin-like peptide [Anaerosacchariphilus polymeriproducens]RDU22341.1 hypothetical protein DWV06_13670 [Anaerosacchariphilus polymeriproducens]